LNLLEFEKNILLAGDKYIFEMRSPKKAAYAAVALSDDVSLKSFLLR
jgi:hypothetical protein